MSSDQPDKPGHDKPGLIGQIKDKLIRAKEEWAREGRLITGAPSEARENRLPPRRRCRQSNNWAALPPGQREVKNWPVLDLGVQPDITRENWRLQVGGLVENPIVWTLDDYLAQPQEEFTSDIHCVTQWSRFDNHWQGVSARHIVFHAYDGYTTNIRREVFEQPNVLLTHSWEGEPIAREHGGPVRVVIPNWYFWKSPKWVTRIVFTAEDQPSFWEVRGYHNEGDPWKEQRYG